jgi:rhamnosyltransferase
MSNTPLLCAVVVTYHPEPELLKQLLETVLPQVAALVVVDNGSDEQHLSLIRSWSLSGLPKVFSLIETGKNLGIAAGQNRGIAWARKQGSSHILLLDQDSIPATDMVKALQEALVDLSNRRIPVAAVGPRLVDRRTKRSSPFVVFNWFGVTRNSCARDPGALRQTDFLVSSGMLVPISVFDDVGLPEEGLFIDNVDMEWCFRARSMGFLLYGVCSAVMLHSVGDQIFRIGPRVLHRHSPIRQYYIMRNRLLLYQRSYTPFGWIVQDAARALFKLLVFALVFAPRWQNICMMCRGIRDAYTGKVGEYRA